MILTLASIVGAAAKGERLVAELESGLDAIRTDAARFPRRPRVYFEEWDEPMISGIGWVSELIAIAGGKDVFSELAVSHAATGRIIADPGEVVRRQPDVILGSWCGKKFRPEHVVARAGWADVPAVRDRELHEIKSADILQPGPAALTDGVRRIHAILARWSNVG
jgi:iron complex transport system substrate-binding protein